MENPRIDAAVQSLKQSKAQGLKYYDATQALAKQGYTQEEIEQASEQFPYSDIQVPNDPQVTQVPAAPNAAASQAINPDPWSVTSKSGSLFKQSLRILKSDKELVLFPFVSVICAIPVVLLFVGFPPLGVQGVMYQFGSGPQIILLLFPFYLLVYFISTFFSVGLASVVLTKFIGKEPATFGSGVKVASQRIHNILGYSLIAAVYGELTAALTGKAGRSGRAVNVIFGTSWQVATAFVAPVLVTTNLSPMKAIGESARIFKSNWGSTLVGTLGFSVVSHFGTRIFTVVAILVLLIGGIQYYVVMLIVVITCQLAVSILVSTCSAIYRTALYYYATTQNTPAGFDRNLFPAVRPAPTSVTSAN